MANATTLTVNKLTANGYEARATVNTLDTGTATVTLNATLTGPADRFFILITNNGTSTLNVWLTAGVNPPSWRSDTGAVMAITTTETGVICCLDAASFLHTGNHFEINFVPLTGGTIGASIWCMELPKG